MLSEINLWVQENAARVAQAVVIASIILGLTIGFAIFR